MGRPMPRRGHGQATWIKCADLCLVGDRGNLRDVPGSPGKRRCLCRPGFDQWRAELGDKVPQAIARADGKSYQDRQYIVVAHFSHTGIFIFYLTI